MKLVKNTIVAFAVVLLSMGTIAPMQKVKTVQTETIAGNLKAACPNFVNGIHGVGLGLSRFVLDCSKGFSATGNFCANHYVLSGLGLTAAAGFYLYVWPQVNIDISYSNHRIVHVNNHHPQHNHR